MSSEVPKGWSKVTLETMADISRGISWTSENEVMGSDRVGMPVLGIRNIQKSLSLKDLTWLTDLKASAIESSTVQSGDILMVGSNGNPKRIGNAVQVDAPGKYLFASLLFGIRPRQTLVDADFLYFAISSSYVQSLIFETVQGTTGLSNLKITVLRSLPILFPPLEEQRRIAEVLRSVDDAIYMAIEVAIEARTTFNKLIDDLHTQNASSVTPLSAFCVPKGLQTGPFGSQLKVSDYVESGIPVVMPTDLQPDGIDFSGAKATSPTKFSQLKQHGLRYGDILFSRRGDVKKCGIYLDGDPTAMCGTGCLRARIDPEKADPVLIYFLIQSEKCGAWLSEHAVGVTMPNLNTSIIGALPVPNLPIEEQASWVDALLLAEGACRINEKYALELGRLKAAIASDLLSGRRRVPSTSTRAVQPAFKRAAFAAEIVYQLYQDTRFGSVKHEKIVHLCELHVGLHDDLNRHAYKEAAGPYDPKARRSVETIFKQQKWFKVVKPDGKKVIYQALEKCGGHSVYFQRYFGNRKSEIQAIIDLLRPMRTEQCEIVATLYAVWNDFLIDGLDVSDEQIVESVLNDWHPSKAQIEKDRWLKALPWMRKNGLVPRGSGEKTRSVSA